MKYAMLDQDARGQVMSDLLAMPEFLAERFADLSVEAASRPDANGGFSPVEHCWHLADLEREGFGERITRLRHEAEPVLPDFDGARLAHERQYRAKPLIDAIVTFREARRANLAAFAALNQGEWAREGSQEGVGKVALCDLPAMMAEHDRTHRSEIEAWSRTIGR